MQREFNSAGCCQRGHVRLSVHIVTIVSRSFFLPSASSYQIFKHFKTPSNNFTAARNASPYHFVCGEDLLSYSLCIHAELPALKSRLCKMVFSDIPADLVSINRDRAAKARKILGESRRTREARERGKGGGGETRSRRTLAEVLFKHS